jgi:hypothetical protein
MKTMWNDADREELLARIDRLSDDATARWGKMTAGAMLAHITEAMKMAVGELVCKPKKMPIRFFPLKQLIVYVFPFPKSAPTAKELLEGSDTPPARSKAELRRLIALFVSKKGQKQWPSHPAFGALSEKAWGALGYKHLDHHLRQFGV